MIIVVVGVGKTAIPVLVVVVGGGGGGGGSYEHCTRGSGISGGQ